MDLVEQVKNGLDVHTATANLTGVERREAKTLNFMLLYGGGVVKLAMALFKVTAAEPILWVIWKQANGWRLDADDKKWLEVLTEEMVSENLPELYKAEKIRQLYFSKLPMVEKLIDECKTTAADRGYIHTWTGRKVYFKRAFAYKAPNALIQGGASDVCKVAIIEIDKMLSLRKSKLLLSIHDELVLKIHKEEKAIIPEIKDIMANSFPHKHLPLTVAANIGENLWDMEKV
jgi:DNA polymerase I-like protein with 3'-5' exonuclease and polymerase domains